MIRSDINIADTPISSGGRVSNTPYDAYVRQSRAMVSLVSHLRDLGVSLPVGDGNKDTATSTRGQELPLPTLVVCGNQSVGKTSLLESLCSLNLPRSDGTCTRCVMEIRLLSSATPSEEKSPWSCRLTLKFTAREKSDLFGPVLTQPESVGLWVSRAQMALLNPSKPPESFYKYEPDRHSPTPSSRPEILFSTDIICLEVTGSSTNLSLIDLPGLIQSVEHPQDAHYIAMTQSLVSGYMEQPNSIILAVISCKDEIENQSIFQLSKSFDPEGRRTIGILTKPDTIEAGTEQKWMDIALNQKFPLGLGYWVVKLPDKRQILNGITLSTAIERERAFFAKTAPWNTLAEGSRGQSRVGIDSLRDELSRQLTQLIIKSLPKLRAAAQVALGLVHEQLSKLPSRQYLAEWKTHSQKGAKRYELLQLVHNVAERIRLHISASENGFKLFYQEIMSNFAQFQTAVHGDAPVLDEMIDHHHQQGQKSDKNSCSNQEDDLNNHRDLDEDETDNFDDAVSRPFSPMRAMPIKSSHFGHALSSVLPSQWLPSVSHREQALFEEYSSMQAHSDKKGLAAMGTESREKQGPPLKNTRANTGLEKNGSQLREPFSHVSPKLTLSMVQEMILAQRGRELHGYASYNAFKNLIHILQEKWERYALECLDNCVAALHNLTNSVSSETIAQYPRLHHKLAMLLEQVINQLFSTTVTQIRHLVQMERRTPFTLSLDTFHSQKQLGISRLRSQLEEIALATHQHPTSAKYRKPYVTESPDSSSEQHHHSLREDASQVIAAAQSYYQISSVRFIDQLSMTIDHHFLNTFAEQIESRLVQDLGVMDLSEVEVEQAMEEEEYIRVMRKTLLEQQDKLEKCCKLMACGLGAKGNLADSFLRKS